MAILIDNLNKVTQEPFLCWINFFLMNTYDKTIRLMVDFLFCRLKQL